jgi:ferric-dicitrate binding protein FerR (iron transport regulator)
MNESRYWFLTGRYLSNSLTNEEKKELDSFIETNEANRKQFEYHALLWKSFGNRQKDIDFNSKNSWIELKARMVENDKQNLAKTRRLIIWRSIAAAVMLALISTGTVLIVKHSTKSVILETLASKQLFILPDSTAVWLNKNSTLSYNSEFNNEAREVKLNGEAYFEVKHNAAKPFIIKSNQTYTKVLGTKFYVRGYESDTAVIVSVVQGKVQFGRKNSEKESLILTKNCAGTFLKNSKGLQKTISENPNALAWQTNKMVFLNNKLTYVIAQLEEYYNIKIDVKSPEIESCSFSGTFDNQTFDEVIKILEFTLNLDFLKDNNSHYSVTGQKCEN